MELYTVTVPSAEQPITLEEAKEYMRVTFTADDATITALISAATEQLEQYTGQVFVQRTIKGEFDSVLYAKTEVYPYVKIRRAPLISVDTVQVSVGGAFVDEEFQTKEPTHGYSRILFPNLTKPLDDIPYPLQIVFDAGYGAASDVPEQVKTAIKMHVNALYRNRNDCGGSEGCAGCGISQMVKGILSPYRILEVFA